MNIVAIGSEEAFLRYCTKRNLTVINFPQELEFVDNKNKGYHYVYEKNLFQWVDSYQFQPSLFLCGSGDYHYISHAILRRVIDTKYEGYTVLLIDNHSDTEDINVTNPVGDYPLNCATHIRETIRKGKALEVIHVYNKEQLSADRYSKEGKEEITGDIVQEIIDNTFEEIYLSIDIDVLSHDVVDIENYQVYDQGNMPMDELISILHAIQENKTIIGVDVCGMSKDTRAEEVYDAILKTLQQER